jgi:type VI secretion system protein ImpL
MRSPELWSGYGAGAACCVAFVCWAPFLPYGHTLWSWRGAPFLATSLVAGLSLLTGARKAHAEGKKAAEAGGQAQQLSAKHKGKGGGEEIEILIREAESRLGSSPLGRNGKLSNLPVILLFGPPGSGKTSVVCNSGLDPELLAGAIFQGEKVSSTRDANLWFARETVFIEAGEPAIAEPGAWNRLLRRLAHPKLQSIFSSGGQAPRAAVVCVDCEKLMDPQGARGLAEIARAFQARLREIARQLGISFPVYVVFTKLDSIRFFDNYSANLTGEDSSQILGVTLPIQSTSTGVYAEQQSRRLAAAFEELFLSLSGRRPAVLRSEFDSAKWPGIYEFPREFRKLRAAVVQFLVDLCRPAQLGEGPFLRGFYFTGFRTVMTSGPAPSGAAAPGQRAGEPSGATAIFDISNLRTNRGVMPEISGATQFFDAGSSGGQDTAAGMHAQGVQSRPVQQPVFLSHLFADVLLKDDVALGTSGASAKVSSWRRILLGAAVVALIVWSAGLIASFMGNSSLASHVRALATAIPAAELTGSQLPALSDVQKLDQLRQVVERLGSYEVNGAPWRLRWGIYAGGHIAESARKIYFNRFHALLFAEAQNSLLAGLRALPLSPGSGDAYKPAYEDLKAYLITTTHHEKSTTDFLPPVLLRAWNAGRQIDPNLEALAQQQFEFYSEALTASNPYSSEAEMTTVEHARGYLSHFAGTERIYQSMLAAASGNGKAIDFNRDFPGSAAVVVNRMTVPVAFTKQGWRFMQDAIKHPDRYFNGEEWVLGPPATSNLPSAASLQSALAARYETEYVNQWRAFLKSSSFRGYDSPADAARKLEALSGNRSPLLELFWVVSRNTSMDPFVAKAFQPVLSVVPGSFENQYVGGPNKSYVDALLGLQTSMAQLAQNPGTGSSSAAVTQISASATNARTATETIAQSFVPDSVGHVDETVRRLMLAPITSAQSVMPKPGADLNAQGRALCRQFHMLAAKYPFNPSATAQASMRDFDSFFNPVSGALMTFYNSKLSPLLAPQAGGYAAVPGAALRSNPAFVNFFNRAAAISKAVYPDHSSQARLLYTLTAYPAQGLEAVSVTIDGQTVTSTGSASAAKQFVWPGAGTPSVAVSGKLGPAEASFVSVEGPWAVFRFFLNAESWQPSAGGFILEWIPRTGSQPVTISGRPLTIRLGLNMNGAPPIFERNYLPSIGCISKVVQ